MNEPLWEDELHQLHQLHRLADQVSAPASLEARQAIRRRAGVLRRRRQIRRTVAAGALVVLLIGGILALQGRGRADLETGPAEPAGEGSLPALTLDLDGWEVVDVSDSYNQPWDSGLGIEPGMEGTVQAFRRPGQLDGPTIVLQHMSASDAVVPEDGDQTVTIGDREGYLRQVNANSITLRWAPPTGDSQAFLQAYQLSQEQVVQFANGLRARDDDIQFPPRADDQFGFDATELPSGVEEDPMEPPTELADHRQVTLQRGSEQVEIQMDTTGEMGFEGDLIGRLMNDGAMEQITVLDHPAVLFGEVTDTWSLFWQHGDVATVEVFGDGVDPSPIIEGLREISDDEWQDLVDRFESP